MLSGEKVLNELIAFDMDAVQSIPEQGFGEDALPFESLEDYSTDPIGFEEVADMVSNKVRYFFSLSAKYNHRSSEYLEVCGFLERGTKYLGSCCLTAVLLRKKDHELLKLEDLSTHWLYGMVSFNIRKLNRTVDEELAGSGTIPAKWLDMQFRYINLAERLKSTETKIYEYTNYYQLNGDKYVKHALMFSEKAWNRYDVEKYVKKPDFRLAPSFPVISSTGDPLPESGRIKRDAQYSIPSKQLPAPGIGVPETRRDLSTEPAAGNAETHSLTAEPSAGDPSKTGLSAQQEDPDYAGNPSRPPLMGIPYRAAGRCEDDDENGMRLPPEDPDVPESDPEFREIAPFLTKAILRRYREILNGTNSSQYSAATGR